MMYIHPADPRRDNDPKLALYHAEAAREMHQAGQLHDTRACGICLIRAAAHAHRDPESTRAAMAHVRGLQVSNAMSANDITRTA